jgi:hypothetical protein
MPRTSEANRKHNVSGYTLLEIVITLGLSATLLLAIYNSLNSVLQLSSKGESETRELNLARGILQRIDLDLQQFVDSKPAYLQDLLADQFPADFSKVRRVPSSFQLAGTHQMLLIKHLEGTERPQVNRIALNLHESGEHLVAYFRSTRSFYDEFRKSLREVGLELIKGQDFKGLGNGLHRCFLDLSANSREVQIVSIDSSFEREEIIDLQFRYYDGETWQLTTDLFGARVTAVEAVVRIDTRSTSETAAANGTPESPNNTYRLTSNLPESFPEEGQSL